MHFSELTEADLAQVGDIEAKKKRKAEAAAAGAGSGAPKRRRRTAIPAGAQVINLELSFVATSR